MAGPCEGEPLLAVPPGLESVRVGVEKTFIHVDEEGTRSFDHVRKNAERTLGEGDHHWQLCHEVLKPEADGGGGGGLPASLLFSAPARSPFAATSAAQTRVEGLKAERRRHADELMALFRMCGPEMTVPEFQRLQAKDEFVELMRKYNIEDNVKEVDDSVEPWAYKFLGGGGQAGGAEAPGRPRGEDDGGVALGRSFFEQVMAAGRGTDMFAGDGRLKTESLKACCAMAMVHRMSYPSAGDCKDATTKLCEPCGYFHKKWSVIDESKGDRCSKGVDCPFCHVCSTADRNRFKKANQKDRWKAKHDTKQTR
ncbi:unnamed protein product [Prorocentrum cordatum]|uniref:C3H1-type domain-containing protein n=1 Tax=Prorocentrum cordatum TaxID=2364126 RepID=A0ABN9U7D5_9DINO|nr:unnamed protein product [Polarella glacialis]